MLLPVVSEAISDAPRYVAGISFSDRSIRYVEVEKHKEGVLTISAYGQITIPYDVVEDGRVVNMVEFADTIRRLNSSLHSDAHIVIRKDSDGSKLDALAFSGYKHIFEKEGLDSLRGVFIPWQTDAKRICFFANFDTTYVLEITGYKTRLIEKMSKEDFFSPMMTERVKSYLSSATDQRVIVGGKYEDDSYLERLSLFGIEFTQTNIWQNVFDFSLYVPEISEDDSYQYTVPVGLIVSRLMNESQKVVLDASLQKRKTSIKEKKEKSPKDKVVVGDHKKKTKGNGPCLDLAGFWSDIEPLTKLEEDKRKSSEKKMSRKYTKLL